MNRIGLGLVISSRNLFSTSASVSTAGTGTRAGLNRSYSQLIRSTDSSTFNLSNLIFNSLLLSSRFNRKPASFFNSAQPSSSSPRTSSSTPIPIPIPTSSTPSSILSLLPSLLESNRKPNLNPNSTPIGRITPVKKAFPSNHSPQNLGSSNSDFRFLPVIHILVAINLAIFLAWQYSLERLKRHNDPSMYIWMSRNFLSGQGNLSAGRWWTMITCCLSQMDLMHFAVNMFTLYLMAPPILSTLGPASFCALYFGGGVTSSFVSMFWNRNISPLIDNQKAVDPMNKYSHGASGSNYAILSFFACLQPRTTFLLFFVVPVKAWLLVPGILAYDFYNAIYQTGGMSGVDDSAGHLGGMLFGILFWRFRLRGIRMR